MRLKAVYVALIFCVTVASVTFAASPPHPRLMVDSRQLPALREKFRQPQFARFRQLLLSDAEALMNYQGLHPQPGKDIGEGYRAYKLAAQKKTRTLHVLPWAYVLTGDERYRDLFFKAVGHMQKFTFDPNRFVSEFDLTKTGAPAAVAYDLLWHEMDESQRRSYGAWLDSFLTLRSKPSYGWNNNIGAIYFSGVGIVALSRLEENPRAAKVLQDCIVKLKETYLTHSIRPHPDSGYPEGPLYRSYSLLWLLAFVDAYENTTDKSDHGLLAEKFFASSPNYVQTLLGGDGIWVPINDSQPQRYGAADSAFLGARYDNATLRWFSDYATAGLETDDEDRLRNEVGPPYTIYAFLWRDEKPVHRAKLPTLSRLPSLNIGCLRSEGVARPAWMVAARGHGPVEVGHEQRDTASFVLYAGGECFLLDPGYYHGMAEDHSLPAVDGVTPQSKYEAPLTGEEHGSMRSLTLDATPDYRPHRGEPPQGVRRNFVMASSEAVIVLDDIVAAQGAAGNVVTRWQAAVKPEVASDGRSARLVGKQGDVWMQTFGPTLSIKVEGPREFGKGWVYRDWAKSGRVQWYTLTGSYSAIEAEPLITVFTRGDRGNAKPRVAIDRAEGNLQVKLPSGKTVTFKQSGAGWQWKP